MSLPAAAEIVPELLMPPAKVETLTTLMPVAPAEIVPLLVMPPPALEEPNWTKVGDVNASDARRDRGAGAVDDAAREGRDAGERMPLPSAAVIVPLLVMPPEKVDATLM